jgi:DNA (cytosine-5)-methyltransferase 1
MEIAVGIDLDADAAQTFRLNFPEADFIESDVRSVETEQLETVLRRRGWGQPRTFLLFSACAPCQPFSRQRRGRRLDDDRMPLLADLSRFVERYLPDFVFLENVPGMQTLGREIGPFAGFVAGLEDLGYSVAHRVVESQGYGIPQRRRRLVMLASRLGEITFPGPTHGPGRRPYATVEDAIGSMPPLDAGRSDPTIANHRAAGLSPVNMQRIRATREGGGREDWPPDLYPECHRDGYEGHTDVYGRLRWNAPASGLTTRCISYSNGRFGHPDQDRALSVREAARLQTFADTFEFVGSLNSMARQVGNAVPVQLARRFGRYLMHVAIVSNERAGVRGPEGPMPQNRLAS